MDQQSVFVTGATGFIGARLVEALVRRGQAVRALTRRATREPIPGSDGAGESGQQELVQWVRGDITDPDSLARGMQGCQSVYHLAAYAKNWARDPNMFFQQNVQGMRNVFEAAQRHGVDRVVWTSSIMTLGPTPPGVVGDETMPRANDTFLTEYERTKWLAEQEACQWAMRGLNVVIVNPTRVFGPGHMTEGNALARLIDDYDRGKVPILFNRGVNVGNYVLVDDVVEGHLLAMQHGRVGERYILGGENVTLREFFRTIDRVSGKRHFQLPMLRISPLVFAYFQQKRAEWFGVYPTISPGWVRTFAVDWAFRCDKAHRELGYQPTPFEEGIRRTYQWLQGLRSQ